jgi:hypothetical protein
VVPLGSNWIAPAGVATDGAGNVYVADSGNGGGFVEEIIAEGGVTSSTSNVKTFGSGFYFDVAVDGAGNVYVLDLDSGVEEIVALDGLISSDSAVLPIGSFNSFGGMAVDSAGNVYAEDYGPTGFGIKELLLTTPPSLSFANATIGTASSDSPQTLLVQNIGNAPLALPVPNISAGFQLSSASTCPPGSGGGSSPATLAPGICTDLISFLPTAEGPVSGSLMYIDPTGATPLYTIPLSGTGYPNPAIVSVNSAAGAYTAPATAVATTSAMQTAFVNFVNGGTLGSISVLTQGAAGLDFNGASGGTCAVGTAYGAGQACSVQYSFTPTSAGARFGGIVLKDGSGNVLGTTYLSGTGNGALGLFTSAQQTLSVSGLSTPRGLSADGSGNIYLLETNNGNVDKIPAGSSTRVVLQTLPNTGIGGTAVDGAGNLFVNSTGDRTIYEFVSGQAPAVAIASTCGGDDNLEVDGAGNLYYSCLASKLG